MVIINCWTQNETNGQDSMGRLYLHNAINLSHTIKSPVLQNNMLSPIYYHLNKQYIMLDVVDITFSTNCI